MRLLISLLVCFGGFAQIFSQDIPTYWYEYIKKQGIAPYNAQPSTYPIYRNVKTYGAKGDGVTDDTAAIQKAISDGSRCAPGIPGVGCQSATTSPANVYFPSGTYLISSPIVMYYMTNLIGFAHNPLPVLKASANFPADAIALVDGNPYTSSGYPAYGTTNVFYRQVRNLVFDLTATPPKNLVRAIHWPTAQATSLQNCVFKMSEAVGTQHVGVFIENGSGGFMTDLIFYGGHQAMAIGSQQFTMRNMTFYNSATAIVQGFDWGWTFMGLSINNCTTGIDMSSVGPQGPQIGSNVIIDSTFTNTPLGILTARPSNPSNASASLALEHVTFTNVPAAVKGPSSVLLAGNSGTITTTGWVHGNIYSPTGPTKYASAVNAFVRPAGLLNGNNYYTRSKPQYQNVVSANFMSARTAGAKGDGVTDDSKALQNVINSATSAGKIVFLDAGIYKITVPITIGPGAKIVGEAYPVIMASGSYWSNANTPIPVVRVGAATGQTGVVELSDFIVSTQGPTAGAVLIQWNLASPAGTPSGMWDVHTRIGGFAGSDLQVSDCPITGTQPKAACIAASQSMKIANIATGVYLENVWLWTADHDLDDVNNNNTRISVYSGRGLSVESTTGNLWMVGTAVEHHVLYQYQLAGTKNIFMGFIQTETPYYQPGVSAQTPFTPIAARDDPDFATFCAGKTVNCNSAWGLRVLNSTNINVYGAGLYSFFQDYDTTCSDHTATVYNEYCQTQILGIDEGGSNTQKYSGSTFFIYGLNTVGAVSMLDRSGTSLIAESANTNVFASSVIRFVTKVPGT